MKPNILFILVDSLRADKCHGSYKTVLTPNIDAIIKNGTYFEQAISSSDYTITGYGSIFTGLFPVNAGIAGMSYHKIFSKVPNYITDLKNYGYHTYAIMDSFVQKLGLSSYFKDDVQEYDRTSSNLYNGVGQRIISKLESGHLREPWFYFILIEDLHIPIKVPEQFKDKKYSERYDIVVSEIDSWIGRILEKINLERTLVILTADHGDYILSIDDGKKNTLNQKIKAKIKTKVPSSTYDFIANKKRIIERQVRLAKAKNPLEKRSIDTRTARDKYLYDDLVHVPLLFVGYGVPSKGVIYDLVRSVDIFPTIWEIVNLPTRKEKISGRSLVPIFQGKKMEEEPVYLENTVFAGGQKSPKPSIGIRTSRYKYFTSLISTTERVHLYDVILDPLEENNIATENPKVVERMEKTLAQIRKNLINKFEDPEMTEKEIKDVEKELKKLGYV